MARSRGGRPKGSNTYTPEIGEAICERMVDGESLRSICKDTKMPHKATVLRWLKDGTGAEDFCAQYARARELQADTLAADIIDIADNAIQATVNQDRLRIDARKWYAAKMRPRVYGDKTILEGGDPSKPIQITDPRERARRVLLDLWLVDPATREKWGFDPLKEDKP